MDFRSLHCFLMVAEEMNVTRAAQRLSMAQPQFTRIIHSLEEELGFPLLNREKRQIALTPAGQTFLDEVRFILTRYEEAVQTARRISQGETGKLVVGYTAIAMFSVLPDIIQTYQHHPEVELVLHDLSTHSLRSQLKLLNEHRLDVALLTSLPNERGIEHEYVCREPTVVALPANHPLAHWEELRLPALAEEAWIFPPRQNNPGLYDALMRECQQAGFKPRIAQTAGQPHIIISLVGSGVGLAFASGWVQRKEQQPNVVYRSLPGITFHSELHMLWRKQNLSPLIQTFIEVTRELQAR